MVLSESFINMLLGIFITVFANRQMNVYKLTSQWAINNIVNVNVIFLVSQSEVCSINSISR